MANKLFYTILIATAFAVTLIHLSQADISEKLVTDICLGCICDAISGCNQTAYCSSGVCGLFRITWAYWSDGGKLTINNEDPAAETAYANCVNDPYCATNSIQNYMRKYSQDCNGDGTVDCYDYAAIHKLGAYGCSGELPYQYANKLSNCLSSFGGINVRSNF